MATPGQPINLFEFEAAAKELVPKEEYDYIAGGAHDDQIFGQLGDDTIQGDGSIDRAVYAGASRGGGVLTVNTSDEAATDGDGYIEGNGGNDVIFGNLGQDDLISGSSDPYGLDDESLRPDGDDIVFGGAGTRIERNELGAGGDSLLGLFADHALDADTIMGDNAVIRRAPPMCR